MTVPLHSTWVTERDPVKKRREGVITLNEMDYISHIKNGDWVNRSKNWGPGTVVRWLRDRHEQSPNTHLHPCLKGRLGASPTEARGRQNRTSDNPAHEEAQHETGPAGEQRADWESRHNYNKFSQPRSPGEMRIDRQNPQFLGNNMYQPLSTSVCPAWEEDEEALHYLTRAELRECEDIKSATWEAEEGESLHLGGRDCSERRCTTAKKARRSGSRLKSQYFGRPRQAALLSWVRWLMPVIPALMGGQGGWITKSADGDHTGQHALETSVEDTVGPAFLQAAGESRQTLPLLPNPANAQHQRTERSGSHRAPPHFLTPQLTHFREGEPPSRHSVEAASVLAAEGLKGFCSLPSKCHVFFQILLNGYLRAARQHMRPVARVGWACYLTPTDACRIALPTARRCQCTQAVDQLRSGVQDQPGQHDETSSLLKMQKIRPDMVAHTCNPSTLGGQGQQIIRLEEQNLVHTAGCASHHAAQAGSPSHYAAQAGCPSHHAASPSHHTAQAGCPTHHAARDDCPSHHAATVCCPSNLSPDSDSTSSQHLASSDPSTRHVPNTTCST
ncbi:hypothetical protein AAY473_023273 [Plecturocebus cupreus]